VELLDEKDENPMSILPADENPMSILPADGSEFTGADDTT